MNWLKLFGITYFSSVPTFHSQRLQIFMDASVEDREAVKLTKLATGAVHCLDALAVVLPLETGVALVLTYGMSECVPMAAGAYCGGGGICQHHVCDRPCGIAPGVRLGLHDGERRRSRLSVVHLLAG